MPQIFTVDGAISPVVYKLTASYLLLPFPRLKPIWRFLLALLPTAVILLARPFLPAILSEAPAILSYPAVFLAAWIGGLWPGLLSTISCSAYSLAFLRPHLLTAPETDPKGVIRSFMFFYTSIFFTLLVSGLQRALARAARAVQVRDEFLSLASHELKTPLTSLILQAQLRQRKARSASTNETVVRSEELKRMAEMDLRQLSRLNGLVDSMLDISRIELGKAPFHPQMTDLHQLAEEVIEFFREKENWAKDQLELTAGGPVECEVDALQIEQVLTNLITNAGKYAAGKKVRVTVSQEDGKRARLEVADEGPGIAPENHERIFQKFERAHNPHGAAGLGLGLYICRELVLRHGGTIEVESGPGRGARFVVYLPFPNRSL